MTIKINPINVLLPLFAIVIAGTGFAFLESINKPFRIDNTKERFITTQNIIGYDSTTLAGTCGKSNTLINKANNIPVATIRDYFMNQTKIGIFEIVNNKNEAVSGDIEFGGMHIIEDTCYTVFKNSNDTGTTILKFNESKNKPTYSMYRDLLNYLYEQTKATELATIEEIKAKIKN